ncbi:methyltransferase family protein [Paraburkholderia sp. BL8N3]|nr:class I SAM-dependent methyltransferase [Paraburkholderia sp. BL8N3]TCK42718.1 methyltransferase family protein [Paraburkholderia sp. BL8N3]
MAQFHFVEDYVKQVAAFKAAYPIDEAMALSVGAADYNAVGKTELNILKAAGLKSGMSVFDLGCGSGRLANALGKSGMKLSYLGTDVVQDLLDYAATKTPSHYRYVLHRELSVPAETSSVDIACAFSVFTHLLHHETFIYMDDILRALKPGGRLVFSFLEFNTVAHWTVFERTVADQRANKLPVLNTFIERNAIQVLAQRLGFTVDRFIEGMETVDDSDYLGQVTVILSKA